MFDEVNSVVDAYQSKWSALIAKRKNKEFFERLTPIALGWKVADVAEYDRLLLEWRGACDHIEQTWLNDRWIATLHLKDSKLHQDIELIKLMQRRPDASDTLGLDHVDFYDTEVLNTTTVLAEEADLKWTEEENGICKWVSVWFDGTEAKLRASTTLDVITQELHDLNRAILHAKGIEL